MNDQRDEQEQKEMILLFRTLRSLAIANMEHFQDCSDKYRQKFHSVFCLLYENLELGIEDLVLMLYEVAPKCDFDGVRANGYRSLISIIHKCCILVLHLTRHITTNRDSLLFRSGYYCRELEAQVACLGQLKSCCTYVKKLPEWCKDGDLFPDDEILGRESPIIDQLLKELEMMNMECFYGRCLGFQFCDSMQKPLQAINIALASFSDHFAGNSGSSGSKLTSSLINSGKYLMNPELRAKKVCHAVQNATVDFCKRFWNIAETDIVQDLPMIVCPPVRVSQVIDIQPEVYYMPSCDGSYSIKIEPPQSHGGPGVIHTRLISHEFREGQEHLCPKDFFGHKSSPPSPCLIIHCHGGGWVAQSSKSHETYLRHWARDLKVPILSIDYSLAPDYPYPRAVEECLYTYAWAVDNCDWLGSTGDHIVLAGDSAGGNLALVTTLKAIELGIRVPDGLLPIYTPTLVKFVPGPSRLLAAIDPLLPLGLLSKCLAAYAGLDENNIPSLEKTPESTSSYFTPDSELTPSPTKRSRPSFNIAPEESSVIEEDEKENCGIIDEVVSSPSDVDFSTEANKLEDNQITGDDFTVSNQRNGTNSSSTSSESDMISDKNDSGVTDLNKTEEQVNNSAITSLSSSTDIDSGVDDRSGDVGTPDESDKSVENGAKCLSSSSNICDNIKSLNRVVDVTEKAVSCMDINSECNSSDKDADSVHLVTKKKVMLHRRIASDPGILKGQSTDLTYFEQEQKSKVTEVDGSRITANSSQLSEQVVTFHRSSEKLDISPSQSENTEISSFSSISSFTSKIASRLELGNLTLKNIFGMKSGKMLKSPSTPTFSMNLSEYGNVRPDIMKPGNIIEPKLWRFRHLPIPTDPHLSPWYSSDDVLKKLPPISLVTSHLDPLLDDSVMFAKRLRKLGNKVELTVLSDLPHGFLNFVLISNEAKAASDVCVGKIRQLLLEKHKPKNLIDL